MNEEAEAADRVLEAFLPEALGALAPPSRAAAIVRRLRRRRALRRAALAAAAAAAIGLAIWLPAPAAPTYPQPIARGDFSTLDGQGVRRGSLIYARQGGAVLELGGYAQVTLAPFT
ncbi:MAG: hypothetical protein N3A66_10955, partial [Planctomycetota bacterium]|nr:hypothetical protein [Planctomycetota bacterium]